MSMSAPTDRLIAGRFEIKDLEQDLIGQGAMGKVYLGIDRDTSRRVAIKILKPEHITDNTSIIERFIREGEALGQLNHPNIVAMVDAVQEAGPGEPRAYYLVMEYVAGGSLRDLLAKEGSLSLDRSLEIGLDLTDALVRAHRLGIVHRDLKPGNVLMAEDGTPRLTDFGLAHLADGSRLTQVGTFIGTIDYLSPEACNGETVDERVDIWSFGVMLFEMLTGKRPFSKESVAMTLTVIISQPTPNLRFFYPDAPATLVDLIDKMLEKDRRQRLASMRLVGAKLEAILQGRDPEIDNPVHGPRSLEQDLDLGFEEPFVLSSTATVHSLLMQAQKQGKPILDQAGLALAYANREDLDLDDSEAQLLLISAVYRNEPIAPWIKCFDSPDAAAAALQDYYEEYPRPEVRGRIVAALDDLTSDTADAALLKIGTEDDAPAVRSQAALVLVQRGYKNIVVERTLAELSSGEDPVAMATLVAIADEFGLPRDSSSYPRLQVTLAVALRRWKSNRRAIIQQASRTARAGALMAIYGAAVPFMTALAFPEDYRENLEFINLPTWILSGVVMFLLYGALQGFASGFSVGLGDSLWIGAARRRWRLICGSLAGLVYSAFFIAILLLNELPPVPSTPILILANLLYGLILGAVLTMVMPYLRTKRILGQQLKHIVIASVVAAVAIIPYVYIVYQQEANVVYFSRIIFAISLVVFLSLPFTNWQKQTPLK